MKYFILAVPPNNIKNKIVKFQNNYLGDKDLSPIEPHITIKAPSGLAENLKWLEKIEKIVKNFQSFKLRLAEVGMFEDSVVFMSVYPTSNLDKLHKELLLAVDADDYNLGEYFEGDNYNPHLTLAIEKWGVSKEVLKIIKKRAEENLLNLPEFEINLIKIYKQGKEGEACEVFMEMPLLS